MRWFFFLKYGLHSGTKASDDYFLLAEVINVGFNAGESEAIRPLVEKLEKALLKAEAVTQWKPFLQRSYIDMARWAVLTSDIAKLDMYLNKLTALPTENNQFFVLAEKELIEEMMASSYQEKVKPYLLKRISAFDSKDVSEIKKTIEEIVKIKI